jgi:hypothetical protein
LARAPRAYLRLISCKRRVCIERLDKPQWQEALILAFAVGAASDIGVHA